MTNTKVNKCKANDCSHSKKFIDRYDVIDNKVIRKDNHKWHFCQTCDKVVHKDYINYHEMRCKIFHDLQKNWIEKNHYEQGVHSTGVACNL
jgi:nitrite reductase/ring-hydroxylating ferredoxin subunit